MFLNVHSQPPADTWVHSVSEAGAENEGAVPVWET